MCWPSSLPGHDRDLLPWCSLLPTSATTGQVPFFDLTCRLRLGQWEEGVGSLTIVSLSQMPLLGNASFQECPPRTKAPSRLPVPVDCVLPQLSVLALSGGRTGGIAGATHPCPCPGKGLPGSEGIFSISMSFTTTPPREIHPNIMYCRRDTCVGIDYCTHAYHGLSLHLIEELLSNCL